MSLVRAYDREALVCEHDSHTVDNMSPIALTVNMRIGTLLQDELFA